MHSSRRAWAVPSAVRLRTRCSSRSFAGAGVAGKYSEVAWSVFSIYKAKTILNASSICFISSVVNSPRILTIRILKTLRSPPAVVSPLNYKWRHFVDNSVNPCHFSETAISANATRDNPATIPPPNSTVNSPARHKIKNHPMLRCS